MKESKGVWTMGNYTINQGYVVLDENSQIIDWFDTMEEALELIEELEED